jgi:predicted acyl esterase
MALVKVERAGSFIDRDVRGGMAVDWDVPLVMSDGLVLRANVYRPVSAGRYPALMSHGPYGKDLHFEDGYKSAWDIMAQRGPSAFTNSSGKYLSWEVVDPEKWVPDGYVVVRIDSRGAGRSPGFIDHWSVRESQDLYECIEWAAGEAWSSGRIGLSGVSYFATNQWLVASRQPPHLAAMCVWEGFSDFYRDCNRNGGIFKTFLENWYDKQIKTVQHGLGERGPRCRVTGQLVCGPETLSEGELEENRLRLGDELRARVLDDEWFRSRSAQFERIEAPLLSAANWGGNSLHLRGNIEGFVRSASAAKWLEVHGNTHWVEFYTDYGVQLQKRFFDYFLKGERNGWDRQPRVQLNVRHPGEKFVIRHENEWPIARTQWTSYYLDFAGCSLSTQPPAAQESVSFDAMGDGLMFLSAPLERETEITGPSAAKLFVSSTTADADLFLVLQVFDPQGKEVTFYGALDPHTPIAQGWLRASHRELDQGLSTAYRPYHTHRRLQPLTPGEIVELDVEIWPTCLVIPKGYRIGLAVRGKDYVYKGPSGGRLSYMKNDFTGVGPFLHDDPRDRPESIFGGRTALHAGAGQSCHLLLPVVPHGSGNYAAQPS